MSHKANSMVTFTLCFIAIALGTKAHAEPTAASFAIYSPASQTMCNTDNPWRLGKKPIDAATRLASASCFGLEFSNASDHETFLVAQSENAAPIVLWPDSCGAMGEQAETTHTLIPSEGGRLGTLRLDPGAGKEHFYLVRIQSSETSARFKRLLGSYKSLCGAQPSLQLKAPFLSFIDDFAKQNAGVTWQVKSFSHD